MPFQDWEQFCFPQENLKGEKSSVRLDESSRVVLYGAGYGGLMFLELLRKRGIEPECVLDRSPRKQGRTILGVPVRAPDRTVAEDATVIVCLLEMGKTSRQIKAQMEALGCQEVYHMYELREDRALFQDQPLILSPDRNLIWENREVLYQVAPGGRSPQLSDFCGATWTSRFQLCRWRINTLGRMCIPLARTRFLWTAGPMWERFSANSGAGAGDGLTAAGRLNQTAKISESWSEAVRRSTAGG